MTTSSRTTSRSRPVPEPPALHNLPALHVPEEVLRWLDHYWRKLGLPPEERSFLALTQDRREFARWTGRRLNTLALGCYCYLPAPPMPRRQRRLLHHTQSSSGQMEQGVTLVTQPTLPTFGMLPRDQQKPLPPRHRHLIFIEPDLLPKGVEVTVAHELIHLADRVRGEPRRHRHHGYDDIAADEASITGYPLEELRLLLREESSRREKAARQARPIRYIYACPHCGKEYPRVRLYARPVSCGTCDRAFNPAYKLVLKKTLVAGG
jgi:hypothetical protein